MFVLGVFGPEKSLYVGKVLDPLILLDELLLHPDGPNVMQLDLLLICYGFLADDALGVYFFGLLHLPTGFAGWLDLAFFFGLAKMYFFSFLTRNCMSI